MWAGWTDLPMMQSVKEKQTSEEWTLKVRSWGRHLDLEDSESHQINYMICKCVNELIKSFANNHIHFCREKHSNEDVIVADKKQ